MAYVITLPTGEKEIFGIPQKEETDREWNIIARILLANYFVARERKDVNTTSEYITALREHGLLTIGKL